MNRAVFLDRDGVLVRSLVLDGRPYAARTLEDFEVLPDAADALAALRRDGFLLLVVTNQPDVGNGLVARRTVEAMHAELRRLLPLDDIMACYHGQADGCDCRKPRPGILFEAARAYSVDLDSSYMVGDRWSDVEAGRASGCTTIFIDRGYAERRPVDADETVFSTREAAEAILARPANTYDPRREADA